MKVNRFNIVLVIFCIFGLSTCFGSNPNILFNDKGVAKSILSERKLNPFLERVDNSKVTLACLNFSIMSTENLHAITANTVVLPLVHQKVYNFQNTDDFFIRYFDLLPYCKTTNEAFLLVNAEYFSVCNSYLFKDYNHFKTSLYATA